MKDTKDTSLVKVKAGQEMAGVCCRQCASSTIHAGRAIVPCVC